MKNSLIHFLWRTFFFAGFTLSANANSLPAEVFTIGEVKIGETKFEDVRKKYGKARSYRLSKDDGADKYICYVEKNGKLKRYIVFETGEMGGYERVTGFRLTTTPQNSCSTVTGGIPKRTGNGIEIGELHEEFLKKFAISFKALSKSKLQYENVSQREATSKELENLRKNWPNEKETRFDVTETIDARFRNRRLFDYCVHKIESY